jgi:hypothetical protein
MPFFEANPYNSFPLLSPLGLDRVHMVPVRSLSQWKAVDQPGDLRDIELPHNMWVERAFLHSYLQPYNPTNGYSSKSYWRKLCEELYHVVLTNYDAVQNGLQIQEHCVFNDPQQLGCVSARAEILSQMFNVKVVLLQVRNGQPHDVILEHPQQRSPDEVNTKLRTVIVGVDTNPTTEGCVYYSARYSPTSPADMPTQAAPTPEVFEKKMTWKRLRDHRKAEVASTCETDVDSALFACTDMGKFSNSLVTPGESAHFGVIAKIYRHPRISSNPRKVTQRYILPLFINENNSQDSSYQLQPSGEYQEKVRCPLFRFPTLTIGQVTTPLRNIEFSMTVTLLDTRQFPDHLELRTRFQNERQWSEVQVGAWKYIVDKALYKWKHETKPTSGNPSVYAEAPQQPSRARFFKLVEAQIRIFFSYVRSVCVSLSTEGVSQHPAALRLSKLLLHRAIYIATAAGIKHQVLLHTFSPGGTGAFTWDGEELFLNQAEPVLEQALRELLIGIIPNPSHCSLVGVDIAHTTRVAGGTLDLLPLHEKALQKVQSNIESNAAMARDPVQGEPEEPARLIPELCEHYRTVMDDEMGNEPDNVMEPIQAVAQRLYGAAVRVRSKGYAVGSLVGVEEGSEDNCYIAHVTFLIKKSLTALSFPAEELLWTTLRRDVWERAIMIDPWCFHKHYPNVLCSWQDGDRHISKAPDCPGELGERRIPNHMIILPVAPWGAHIHGSSPFEWQNPWRNPPPDSGSEEDEGGFGGDGLAQGKGDGPQEDNLNHNQKYGSSPGQPVGGDQSVDDASSYNDIPDDRQEKRPQQISPPAGKQPLSTEAHPSERGADLVLSSSNANTRWNIEYTIRVKRQYKRGTKTRATATEYVMEERGTGANPVDLLMEYADADGDCLFHAILKHHDDGYQEKDSQRLRKDVIEYIEKNLGEYEEFWDDLYEEAPSEGEAEEDYAARMKRNSRSLPEFLRDAKHSKEYVGEIVVTGASRFLRWVFARLQLGMSVGAWTAFILCM